MEYYNFFRTLFDEGEGICAGSRYANKVCNVTPPTHKEFFCINPLDPSTDHGYLMNESYSEKVARRADVNVSAYRSFLFEMDSVDLETQLDIFNNCGIKFTSIVYSGGKSYHAILSLSEPLSATPHCEEGIASYKTVWRRLRAKLDEYAISKGFELPEGATSFIDGSCQNPSRLSRFPGSMVEGRKKQTLLHLGSRISKKQFEELLDSCPEVKAANASQGFETDDPVESVREFWFRCPKGLKNMLKYPTWVSDSNMYPELYRLTIWAIESTGVDKDTFIEALWQKTFDKLLDVGYPREKLYVAIEHAYEYKRRS